MDFHSILFDIAAVITAVATLVNSISTFRNGRKLTIQDKKMDQQTNVLADVHRATNGELVPKIAEAIAVAKKIDKDAV